MKTLKDLFLDELAEMYDSEQRIVKALPKLIEAATCPQLQTALNNHLIEIQGHAAILEEVFTSIGRKTKGKKCKPMAGLLAAGDAMASAFKDSPAINAAIISAGQKVAHYEIAAYGCLHEWADLLGYSHAADFLEDILLEEKEADEKLTILARTGDNEMAVISD